MENYLQPTQQKQVVLKATCDVDPEQVFNSLDISDNTKKDYLSYINKFIRYAKRTEFNNSILLAYKKYLKNNVHISVSTKNKYLTVAKIYLKELHRLGYLATDITVNIKNFRQSKKHKQTGLNDDEINLLINNLSGTEDYRLRAILAVLTLQGLRQIEVVRLNVNDIDLEQKTLLVTGKGRDDQELIDLHPNTVDALGKYLRNTKKKSGPLFTSDSNNSKNNRLSKQTIWMIVKKYLKKNEVNKTVHGLRHYYTTRLIQELSDLLIVQEFTRHRSLEMLQIYNDRLRKNDELPKYYSTFQKIQFS
jgi:site-specific recombinase XerD